MTTSPCTAEPLLRRHAGPARLAIVLGAVVPLLLFGAGAASAAGASVTSGGGMDSMWVHISGLNPPTFLHDGDKCSLTYDNQPLPSVGGGAYSDGTLNFDQVLMSRGDHVVHISCTTYDGKQTWSLPDQNIHVGPPAVSSALPSGADGGYANNPPPDYGFQTDYPSDWVDWFPVG